LLTGIERLAFSQSSISQLCIPRSIEVLEFRCFWRCKRLELVTFESNCALIRIKRAAFDCSSLRQIRIPKGVIDIEDLAFANSFTLSDFAFEPGSQFAQLSSSAFLISPILEWISIPRGVDVDTVSKSPGDDPHPSKGELNNFQFSDRLFDFRSFRLIGAIEQGRTGSVSRFRNSVLDLDLAVKTFSSPTK
jgi:hypothetical protein